MKIFHDQLGSPISIETPPRRIVSLVPSQTELLSDLGLSKEVTGITKFCAHPVSWRNEKKIIGGTKKLDLDVIDSLNPDLIIGNKEENTKGEIEALREKYPVWMSDIYSLADATRMIEQLGLICDREEKARSIVNDIEVAFKNLEKKDRKRVVYLIWRKPWMAAGAATFINEMLEANGWQNAVEDSRYPELTEQQLHNLQPHAVLLSSEPYPFKDKHIAELREICPKATVHLVDGEMFSWYGSRLRYAPGYFSSLKV